MRRQGITQTFAARHILKWSVDTILLNLESLQKNFLFKHSHFHLKKPLVIVYHLFPIKSIFSINVKIIIFTS